jgi:hypothetical protein
MDQIKARLASLAQARHGHVSTTLLRNEGFSDGQIRTMRQNGWLVQSGRRGHYSVGYAGTGDEPAWSRAVGCCGPDAALDAASAVHAWKLAPASPRRIEVITPRPRRALAGIRRRTDSRMDESWATVQRGVRILTPTRALARYAIGRRPEQIASVMREAAYRRLLDLDALLDIVERERGSRGVAQLVLAISLRVTGSAGARSALELRVIDCLAREWPLAPNYNVKLGPGGRRFEVDLVWPTLLLCAEIDGPQHDEPDVRRDDMGRDARLRKDGWTVIRIHWSDVAADIDTAVAPLLDELTARFAHAAYTQ